MHLHTGWLAVGMGGWMDALPPGARLHDVNRQGPSLLVDLWVMQDRWGDAPGPSWAERSGCPSWLEAGRTR